MSREPAVPADPDAFPIGARRRARARTTRVPGAAPTTVMPSPATVGPATVGPATQAPPLPTHLTAPATTTALPALPLAAPPAPAPELTPPAQEPPANGKKTRRRGKKRATTADTTPDTAPEDKGADEIATAFSSDFTIPAPGERVVGTRKRIWWAKTALLLAPAILVGGCSYMLGVSTGSSRIPAANEITSADATKYGLTTYPIDQAVSYGQQYLAICLSHPNADDDTATAQRDAALKSMTTTSGVDPSCGWDGTGEITGPLSIQYNGRWSPDTVMTYDSGTAAIIEYTVTFTGGRAATYAVPIWYSDDTAGAMRVVGNVGIGPVIPNGSVPQGEPTMNEDIATSSTIGTEVLTPFFTAWGASNHVDLRLVTTTDATPITLQGLNKVVSGPIVSSVRAYSPKQSDSAGESPTYVDGDEITVVATVKWATVDAGQQISTYTLTLRRVSDRWLVYDIVPAAVTGTGTGNDAAATTSSEASSSSAAPSSDPSADPSVDPNAGADPNAGTDPSVDPNAGTSADPSAADPGTDPNAPAPTT